MPILLETGQDILEDVLFRAGESTDPTGATASDYRDQVKNYIMRAYFDLVKMYPWPWALKDPPGIIDVLGEVTGSATFANGSEFVTFDASVTPSMAGRKIYADNEFTMYRIIDHTSGGSVAQIDTTYKETTVNSAYTIFQDEYSLATDCLRPWSFWFRDENYLLDFENDRFMTTYYTDRIHSAQNSIKVSLVTDAKVRIYPSTYEDKTVEYAYTKKPPTLTFDDVTATDTPIIPQSDLHVLADWALYFLLFDRNEGRSAGVAGEAKAKISQMRSWYLGKQKVKLYPRRGARLS